MSVEVGSQFLFPHRVTLTENITAVLAKEIHHTVQLKIQNNSIWKAPNKYSLVEKITDFDCQKKTEAVTVIWM